MCKLGSLIFPLIQHFLKPSRTITFLYQLHTLQSVIHYLIQYEDPLLDVAHIILIKYFPSEEESENKLEWELPILLTQDLILSRKPNTKENNDIRIKIFRALKLYTTKNLKISLMKEKFKFYSNYSSMNNTTNTLIRS